MKTTQKRIDEIRLHGYEMDFGETFNTAFEIYKKTALLSGLAFIIALLFAAAVGFGTFTILFGFGNYNEFIGLQNGNSSLTYQLIYIVAMSLFSGLLVPLTAGIIKMAHSADIGEEISIGSIFSYYKAPYFFQLFLQGIIVSLFTVGVTTLFKYVDLSIMPIIAAIFSATVSFLTILAVPLIIFGKLNAFEAIQGSTTVVLKNPFVILGLIIVAALASMVGLLAFCIGIFFTLPFLTVMYYCLYRNSVGVDESSEIDEIGMDDVKSSQDW